MKKSKLTRSNNREQNHRRCLRRRVQTHSQKKIANSRDRPRDDV